MERRQSLLAYQPKTETAEAETAEAAETAETAETAAAQRSKIAPELVFC